MKGLYTVARNDIMYYLISASVAIIGSGKYCDHISVMGPVISFHHQLVSSE